MRWLVKYYFSMSFVKTIRLLYEDWICPLKCDAQIANINIIAFDTWLYCFSSYDKRACLGRHLISRLITWSVAKGLIKCFHTYCLSWLWSPYPNPALCYAALKIKFTTNAVVYTHLNYNCISIITPIIIQISPSIQMLVYCNICSVLLCLNTLYNLSPIKTHRYIAITFVCLCVYLIDI